MGCILVFSLQFIAIKMPRRTSPTCILNLNPYLDLGVESGCSKNFIPFTAPSLTQLTTKTHYVLYVTSSFLENY